MKLENECNQSSTCMYVTLTNEFDWSKLIPHISLVTEYYQSELIGQWVHHTISLMYVGARHLEFGITSHIVT